MSLLKRGVYYNNYNLENIPGLTLLELNPYGSSERELYKSSLANADGEVISGENYRGKIVEIKGYLVLADRYLMEQTLETLRGKLNYRNKILQVEMSNDIREFTATPGALILEDTKGGYTKFTIPFYCTDPHNYAVGYTTALDVSSLTNNEQSYTPEFDGNDEQLPYITYTIDSISGGTGTVYFDNDTRSESMRITRTWEVGDILIIDAEVGTVKVNGTEVDYSGPIIRFNPGSNSFTYNDTFTTRSIDLIIDYRKRYL